MVPSITRLGAQAERTMRARIAGSRRWNWCECSGIYLAGELLAVSKSRSERRL